jgi:hypothetical protein
MGGFAVIVFAVGLVLAFLISGTLMGNIAIAFILLLSVYMFVVPLSDRDLGVVSNIAVGTIAGAMFIALIVLAGVELYLMWLWLQPMITCHYACP